MVEIVGLKQLNATRCLKISEFLECVCASAQKMIICRSSWTSWICFICHSAEIIPLGLHGVGVGVGGHGNPGLAHLVS